MPTAAWAPAKRWDFSRGVYLHGFWCYEWADETLKAATYNPETGELRLAAKHAYGIGTPRQPKSPRPFYAIHVFEELDRPGEYYLDRPTGKLYFWPPSAVSETPVRLSLCHQPLLKANRVANLTVRDVVFENACGWAVDLTSDNGSGIDAVHVWAYRLDEDGAAVGPFRGAAGQGQGAIWLGVAAAGPPRPDVGRLYGPTFTDASYHLDIGGLAPGAYDLVVYPHRARTATFDGARAVRINVR